MVEISFKAKVTPDHGLCCKSTDARPISMGFSPGPGMARIDRIIQSPADGERMPRRVNDFSQFDPIQDIYFLFSFPNLEIDQFPPARSIGRTTRPLTQ